MNQIIKEQVEEGLPEVPLQKLSLTTNNQQKIWNSGHWSTQENMRCIAFFQYNKAHLHSKLKIKQNKFFKQMSIFVDSRNPIQCRSQCQKLLRKYKTFYNIIQTFKIEYNQQRFQEEYEKYAQNPLIRFKGTIELNNFEKHAEMSREMSIQTQKSYLQRKFRQRQAQRRQQERQYAMNQFPFLRAGWWL